MDEMRERSRRWPLYGALVVLYLLHNDLWLWNDARLVLGLPIGLLYHVVFCLVTAVVLAMLVKWAWPALPGAEPREGASPSPTVADDGESAR